MEKRVDIKLQEETLKWAGIEAAKIGISRRQYLARIIERRYVEEHSKVVIGGSQYPVTPDEAQQQPKCSSNT